MSTTPTERRNYRDVPSYACGTCGKPHVLPPYVISHWFKTVLHHCDACFAIHEVTQGVAILKMKGATNR
ncbi:hypothetical protein LMG28688_00783 [Paraburkholderia caffeinitolerans]|uniref:Uncharacterized protein n=1 Tax=Paraburkholderia caffeinitolerans TaxID=1723730 RepID=A0A6J5FGQ4_9BURK|nr:hypothetical protein LMG28688_00783 [Paraburkholderia caffeinitolerans]